MSGILILGGAGRLGRELDKTLHQLGARNVVAASRAEADAADPASVLKLSNRFPGGRPNWVVCAAAWSDVPRAEVDKTGAFRGNVLAPRGAALAAAHWDVPLLHYSSDYVFSGGGRRLLHSDLRPKPQGAYGRTKRSSPHHPQGFREGAYRQSGLALFRSDRGRLPQKSTRTSIVRKTHHHADQSVWEAFKL